MDSRRHILRREIVFSINTNIASLQAQNYLRINQNFQNQTINEVTSGLRIVNSGDDAAGLAIANTDRSNEAVLTEGIQNANNGLSQLQIADGGLSNISQLLDRARTLATQSASGAFTGDRGVLNAEFQSVITEVDRQAQAIGLNQGGVFATNLNVFVGGGTASGNISAAQNGTVSVNLAQATVDAKSLGLQGVQASGVAGTDIGDGSSTSVQNILADSSNQASITNNTATFSFTGPGFSNTSGSNVVKVAVNLTGVTDTDTLVAAINQAIENAGNGASQQATAFKNANITAAINTDSTGKQQLTFSSGTTAFQVQGDDQVANAFLGNFATGAQGTSALSTATAAAPYAAPAADETVNFRIVGAGLTGSQGEFNVALLTTDTTAAEAVAKINTAIAANAPLAATGITATSNGSGAIQFVGGSGQSFQVQTAGDAENAVGFGTFASSNGYSATGGASAAGNFDYNSITAAAAALQTAGTQNLQVSINGGATIDLGAITVAATGSAGAAEAAAITAFNTAFQGNAATRSAGLVASDNGAGNITISSANSTNFRVNLYGGTAANQFGFGQTSGGTTATAVGLGNTASSYAAITTVDSAGAQQSVNATNHDVYQFTGLTNNGDSQTVTLSTTDANGNQHSLNIALNTGNAATLDQALATINQAILSSNDSTLQQIVAVKQVGQTPAGQASPDEANGQEGIAFLSAGNAFKVSLGSSQPSSTSGVAAGITDGGPSAQGGGTDGGAVLTSVINGTGSTANISNIATATAAVNQLATSVAILGAAQAAVGRGENQFNYAINLANSQLTNLAAAESGIRDADMAQESANLTKASIQLQAGIAALAQANSAPQQILSLLKQ
jgi:flagellin